MPRLARIVVPGHPHHIVQRGVRRQRVFLCEEDYRSFERDLAEGAREHGLAVWAWCLMPNHLHLLAVPAGEDSLAAALGLATWRHARRVNLRKRRGGRLWQGRFYSCVLDGDHAAECARYVELNPVRAGLARGPSGWRHSSARFHLRGKRDGLTSRGALAGETRDWKTFLADGAGAELGPLREHTSSGRPLGSGAFLDLVERALGRPVRPRPRGRPPARSRRAAG